MSDDNRSLPLFSVVIPARDEEQHLPGCLASIARAWSAFTYRRPTDHFQHEIVVVLNRCTDKTEEIAVQHGCLVVSEDAKNLAAIRNVGVRACRGEIIITIDADSLMSVTMFEAIYSQMQRGSIIGGGVLIVPERWSLGIGLTALLLVPIALWYRISGGLFFFRRETFERIGGFDESLPSVEDIFFARALKDYGRKQNKRFANLFRAHIVTSCRKFDRFGDWYFLRNLPMTIRLLRGIDAAAANRIWYDFKR